MSKAWMPLYIGDYLGDTSHLSQGQHGAYLLLMMHYWQKGNLPSDRQQCYCIAHALDEQSMSNVDAVVTEFFVNGRQKRLDAELEKAKKSYERRAGAAEKRWNNAKHLQSTKSVDALHEHPVYDSDSNYDSVDLELLVREIAKFHPKIQDHQSIPQDTAVAIAEAVARHGGDAVLVGTKSMAEMVAKWPASEKQFISSASRYYRESQYLRDPKEWERSSNGAKPSNAAVRSDRSKQNIFEGITTDARRRTAPDEPERKDGARAGTGGGVQSRVVGGTA